MKQKHCISQSLFKKKMMFLIMDRGYYSYNLLKQIYDQNFDAVFRIKNNSKLIYIPTNY